MGQTIGGLIWDAMILGGFVYLFLVMRGIVKTAQPVKMIQQPNIFVKVLIYGGLLLFATLFVMDLFALKA